MVPIGHGARAHPPEDGGVRPGVCTAEEPILRVCAVTPASVHGRTGRQAALSSHTVFLLPCGGLTAQGSQAPRPRGEARQEGFSRRTANPHAAILLRLHPAKNLRREDRFRAQPDPAPRTLGKDLLGRARQDCKRRSGTEKAQRHPGWEGVVCPLSWNDHGCD